MTTMMRSSPAIVVEERALEHDAAMEAVAAITSARGISVGGATVGSMEEEVLARALADLDTGSSEKGANLMSSVREEEEEERKMTARRLM